MVHACQKSGDCASPEVKKVAGEISDKDAEDFAATKHKSLPEKKEEWSLPTFTEWLARRRAISG